MEAQKLDMLKIILDSGIVVKLVLLSLIASSVVSWAIVIKKRKVIRKLLAGDKKFLEVYNSSSNLKQIRDETNELPESTLRPLFDNGFDELQKIKDQLKDGSSMDILRSHFETFGLGVIERGLSRGVNESNRKLEELLSILASIGSITPFIGLFGTVWGIIDSFTGLAGGGATLDAVAPGIAEALIATAVGLAAAIPAVWFYNYFSSENSVINGRMEDFGQDLLNRIERTLMSN